MTALTHDSAFVNTPVAVSGAATSHDNTLGYEQREAPTQLDVRGFSTFKWQDHTKALY